MATIEEDYHVMRQEVLEEHHAIDHTMDIATSGLRHINEVKPRGKNGLAIADGLKQTYKRGHKAYNHVMDMTTMENLHEWRKQAKYLGYQLAFMKEMDKSFQKLSKKIKKVTDLLGDEHDLAMLQHKLVSDHIAHQKVDAGIAESLARRRKKLQKKVVELGKRIYDEKPKRFIKYV